MSIRLVTGPDRVTDIDYCSKSSAVSFVQHEECVLAESVNSWKVPRENIGKGFSLEGRTTCFSFHPLTRFFNISCSHNPTIGFWQRNWQKPTHYRTVSCIRCTLLLMFSVQFWAQKVRLVHDTVRNEFSFVQDKQTLHKQHSAREMERQCKRHETVTLDKARVFEQDVCTRFSSLWTQNKKVSQPFHSLPRPVMTRPARQIVNYGWTLNPHCQAVVNPNKENFEDVMMKSADVWNGRFPGSQKSRSRQNISFLHVAKTTKKKDNLHCRLTTVWKLCFCVDPRSDTYHLDEWKPASFHSRTSNTTSFMSN